MSASEIKRVKTNRHRPITARLLFGPFAYKVREIALEDGVDARLAIDTIKDDRRFAEWQADSGAISNGCGFLLCTWTTTLMANPSGYEHICHASQAEIVMRDARGREEHYVIQFAGAVSAEAVSSRTQEMAPGWANPGGERKVSRST
jgi:hypothetical protein